MTSYVPLKISLQVKETYTGQEKENLIHKVKETSALKEVVIFYEKEEVIYVLVMETGDGELMEISDTYGGRGRVICVLKEEISGE